MPESKSETTEQNKHHDQEEDHEEGDENPQPAVKDKKHDSGVADLEKVTDYAEDKEILSTGNELEEAIVNIRKKQDQKKAEKLAAQKEKTAGAAATGGKKQAALVDEDPVDPSKYFENRQNMLAEAAAATSAESCASRQPSASDPIVDPSGRTAICAPKRREKLPSIPTIVHRPTPGSQAATKAA